VTGLTNRNRKILFSVVAEYIATGAPVGSRTLARKYAIELSPASIRNVLSDLEDAGYLRQPHTSAGRVPTERALRAFIGAITEFQEIPHKQEQQMRERFAEIFAREHKLGREAMRRTGKYLSDLSGAAAVVATSHSDTRQLSQLRFIVTKPTQLLAVLVFNDGMVENRYIAVDKPITESVLNRIHNLMADVVEGRTLGALRDLFARRLDDQRVHLDQLRCQAFALGNKALEPLPNAAGQLIIEGRSKLLELPEYADVDRLRKLMHALEDREHLLVLLNKTITAGAASVYIGEETGQEGDLGAAQLSLVVAPIVVGDKTTGSLGVLGPTRMDYAKILPLVDATAAALTAAMKKDD